MGRCPQNKTCHDAECSPPRCPCREFSVFVTPSCFCHLRQEQAPNVQETFWEEKTKLANLLAANLVFSVGRMGIRFLGPKHEQPMVPKR